MAEGVNKAILIGNLGKDPVLSYTQSGTAKAVFSLATGESYKNAAGERQDRTEWHNIVVWGKQAEIASKYLSKGKQVYIEGRIQSRSWDDKEGNKRYITEITAQKLTFLGSREGGGGGGYGGGQGGGGYGGGGQGGGGQGGGGYGGGGQGGGGYGGGGQGGGGGQDGGGQGGGYDSPAPDDDDIPF